MSAKIASPQITKDIYAFIRLNSGCKRTFSSSCQNFQGHYDTLGVPRTASLAQIKTSFYRLSQQYHPDLNKEPGAREKFQKVSEAWAVLKDGRERREYDRKLRQGDVSNPAGGHTRASYDDSAGWSSHSRRHTRQSAQWAWSSPNSRSSTGGPGSAFRKPHRANDPFSNPHVQRATGKTRTQESSSNSWFSDSDPYYRYAGESRRTKSSASARAEEEHVREAEAHNHSGLWGTFPTIGVTLLFLMFAHGWGAKA